MIRSYNPLVWFLYEDLGKSAQSLTNEFLNKSIKNALQLIVCTHYYYKGIHTKKIFDYLFAKDRREQSIDNYFPGFNCKYSFKFALYKNRVAKWARACKENYSLLAAYLICMLEEWSYRFPRKPHKFCDVACYFLDENNIVDKLPNANLKVVLPEWKSIPLKYRFKDIYLSYRKFYKSKIKDPFKEYEKVSRDIPDFLINES